MDAAQTRRAARVQPPEATGGAGFTFEEAVGAWYLLHLLLERAPFDSALGPPVRVKFQVAVDGWPLDDILIELANPPGARAAVSVKSNPRDALTSRGFSAEFLRCCWALVDESSALEFNSAIDLAVIATSGVPTSLRRALNGLLLRACGDPVELWTRSRSKTRWLNKTQRALLESFGSGTNTRVADGAAVGQLLRSVRLANFDFGDLLSRSEQLARANLLHYQDGFDAQEAERVWTALRTIARTLRESSGAVSRVELLERLAREVGDIAERLATTTRVTAVAVGSDPLPDGPSEATIYSDSELPDDAMSVEGEERARAVAALLPIQQLRWVELCRREAIAPPWDRSLEAYMRAMNDGSIDVIVRNGSATSAVLDAVQVTLLRDFWPIAGEMAPAFSLHVDVDSLRVGDECLVRFPNPLEVLPGRAERFWIETRSYRAVVLRVRIHYSGRYSIARNVALYDAELDDEQQQPDSV